MRMVSSPSVKLSSMIKVKLEEALRLPLELSGCQLRARSEFRVALPMVSRVMVVLSVVELSVGIMVAETLFSLRVTSSGERCDQDCRRCSCAVMILLSFLDKENKHSSSGGIVCSHPPQVTRTQVAGKEFGLVHKGRRMIVRTLGVIVGNLSSIVMVSWPQNNSLPETIVVALSKASWKAKVSLSPSAR